MSHRDFDNYTSAQTLWSCYLMKTYSWNSHTVSKVSNCWPELNVRPVIRKPRHRSASSFQIVDVLVSRGIRYDKVCLRGTELLSWDQSSKSQTSFYLPNSRHQLSHERSLHLTSDVQDFKVQNCCFNFQRSQYASL